MKGLRIPCGCFFPCMGNTDCIIKTGWSLENVFDVFLNFVLLIDSSNSSYPVFLPLAWSVLKWPLFLEMYEVSQWTASYPIKLRKKKPTFWNAKYVFVYDKFVSVSVIPLVSLSLFWLDDLVSQIHKFGTQIHRVKREPLQPSILLS